MEEVKDTKPKKKNIALPIILGLILIIGGWYGINAYLFSRVHEDTDDAQLEGNIDPISPRVGGYVTEVNVDDYMPVKAGDVLVKLDDRDLASKVSQAEAALESAKANLAVVEANIASSQVGVVTSEASIKNAQVKVWQAQQDFNRSKNLLAEQATTQKEYDAAKAALEGAQTQLDVVKTQQTSAQKNYAAQQQQMAVAKAAIAQRQADLDYAKLQLSYAVIKAPVSGRVSKKNVQVGQYVQPGQSLFSVVIDSSVWVVANFKETQLEKMRLGQHATIEVDAFKDHPLDGSVEEFSSATGAKFSLLPPDNATGNFVKVVQRVPVKIKINADKQMLALLRPGMNVHVIVDTK
jgi:membrane fusion protein (multidrug efflux system)